MGRSKGFVLLKDCSIAKPRNPKSDCLFCTSQASGRMESFYAEKTTLTPTEQMGLIHLNFMSHKIHRYSTRSHLEI
jgi:hypothetical protein